jgi:hypothetical protein
VERLRAIVRDRQHDPLVVGSLAQVEQDAGRRELAADLCGEDVAGCQSIVVLLAGSRRLEKTLQGGPNRVFAALRECGRSSHSAFRKPRGSTFPLPSHRSRSRGPSRLPAGGLAGCLRGAGLSSDCAASGGMAVGAVPPTALALGPRTPRPVTRLDGLPNRPEHDEQEPDERDWKEDHAPRLAATPLSMPSPGPERVGWSIWAHSARGSSRCFVSDSCHTTGRPEHRRGCGDDGEGRCHPDSTHGGAFGALTIGLGSPIVCTGLTGRAATRALLRDLLERANELAQAPREENE